MDDQVNWPEQTKKGRTPVNLPALLETCVDIYDVAMKEYAIVGTKDGEKCTVFRVPRQSGMVRAYVVADGAEAETLVRRLVLEEVVHHVIDVCAAPW